MIQLYLKFNIYKNELVFSQGRLIFPRYYLFQ